MTSASTSFFSDGDRVNARLVLPNGKGPFPAVVLCQGLGSTWDRNAQPALAGALAERGIASLMFDHRGLGESEGARGRYFPWSQVEDIRSAITYLTALPEIAERAVGLSGASFGGANAITAGALDDRVTAIFAACAFAEGSTWMRDIRRYWEWEDFLDRLRASRVRQAREGVFEMVALDEILIRDPEGQAYADAMAAESGPRELVALELAARILEYSPLDHVKRISPRPLMLLHGSNDRMIPADHALRLADLAGENKRLVLVEGAGHYNLYSTYLDEYRGHAVEFFSRQLSLS